jgi:hypothetical protein
MARTVRSKVFSGGVLGLHASITNTVSYTAESQEPFKDIWR